MKKSTLTLLVAMAATAGTYAQTIAVVSSAGTTTMYQNLDDAITGAEAGSTIYLPGGGFNISDDLRIDRKLTIMGVSHRADTDNADGASVISGNIWFNSGSDGSCVMGVYISGDVNIAEDSQVNNILLRYCNANSVQVKNSSSTGITVNQCYMRSTCNMSSCNARMTNNVLHSVLNLKGGTLSNNVVCNAYNYHYWYSSPLVEVDNSVISNNILLEGTCYGCDECQVYNNMAPSDFGDNCTVVSDWSQVLVDSSKGVNITSDFHFVESSEYEGSDIGIYGGTGFSDEALAPIPRIVSKTIPEQTDESGKLNITITVKAN